MTNVQSIAAALMKVFAACCGSFTVLLISG